MKIWMCAKPCFGGDPCEVSFNPLHTRPPIRCGNGRFNRFVLADKKEAEK